MRGAARAAQCSIQPFYLLEVEIDPTIKTGKHGIQAAAASESVQPPLELVQERQQRKRSQVGALGTSQAVAAVVLALAGLRRATGKKDLEEAWVSSLTAASST